MKLQLLYSCIHGEIPITYTLQFVTFKLAIKRDLMYIHSPLNLSLYSSNFYCLNLKLNMM